MSHIFISYSRRDLVFAQKIVNALAANNLDTWIDWKSIPKGEDWEQEIYHGIEEADAFLFLISPDSVASQMCNKEIAHAVKNGKRILPIVLRDTDRKIIHAEINKRNWIFCRAERDDFHKTIAETREAIHADYEWLRYHTKLQGKALDWERRNDQKDVSRLLRGRELREAEEQLAKANNQEHPQPTRIQHEYVLASRRNEEQIRRRKTIVTSGIAVVMSMLAIGAWLQRNEAVEQRNVAKAGELSLRSSSERLEKNIDLAMLLGVEAVNAAKTFESQNALLLALEWAPRLRTFLPKPGIYAVFSPDGKLMASIGTKDGAISLWRLDGLDPFTLISTFSIEGQNPRVLSFSANNKILAILGSALELWDISAPEAPSFIAAIQYDLNRSPRIAIDPSRSVLAIGYRDGQLNLYDISNPSQPELTGLLTIDLNGETFFDLNQIAYSPNGQLLAASVDEWVVLIDVSNPAAPEKVSQTSTNNYGASNISINSDGKILVLADDGGYMDLIDISDPLFPTIMGNSFGGSDNYGGESAGGITVAFSSHDPEVLASVSCTNMEMGVIGICLASDIFLWEVHPNRDPRQFIDPLGGHSGNIYEVAFQPGEEFVIAIDSDDNLFYWDISNVEVLPSFANLIQIHDAAISSMAVSSDASLFVSGDRQGTINIWDISKQDDLEILSKIIFMAPASRITISPTKKFMAVASGGGFALWNISRPAAPTPVAEYPGENSVDIMDLVFNSKETEFYSIRQDGIINSWSTSDPSVYPVGKTTVSHFGEVTTTTASPDGKLLALGHESGSISLWKIPDLYLLKWFDDPLSSDYGNSVNGIAFTVDGKSLVASYEFDNEIYFWDIYEPPTVRQPKMVLEGSQPGVNPGVFGISMAVKNGLLIVNGCRDEDGEGDCSVSEIRLWDLSTVSSPRSLGIALPGSDNVNEMVIVPNGNLLISGGPEGAIVFWHLDAPFWIRAACNIAGRNFTLTEWAQYFPGEEYRLTCPQWPAGE